MTKVNFARLLTSKVPFLRKIARSFLYGDGLYLGNHHITLIKTDQATEFTTAGENPVDYYTFYFRSNDLFIRINYNLGYREDAWLASLLIMRGSTIWGENTIVEDSQSEGSFQKILLALLNNLHYSADSYPDLKMRYPPNLHRPELRRWH